MRIRVVLALGFAALVFLVGAAVQSGLNRDMTVIDQSSYMEYAKELRHPREDGRILERSRMPCYPWIMSLVYRSGMEDRQFFAIGKCVNVCIALVVLGVAYRVFRFRAAPLDACAATLVAAFTVFVYKAPYFQCELLFYGLSLLLFASLVQLVRQPTIPVAVACGVVAGIAHLTKASVLPAVLLGVACLGLRTGLSVVAGYRGDRTRLRDVTLAGLSGLVMLCSFLAVVFPYIHTSKRVFGSYFYNVNSTFYVWYDSWEEARRGTMAFDDNYQYPNLPPDQLPSFRKYLRDHSAPQIAGRLVQGLGVRWMTMAMSYGYVEFLVLYFATIALLAWQNRQAVLALVRDPNRCLMILFVLGYFALYYSAFAWYYRIALGNRFTLALLLPYLFSATAILGYAQKRGWELMVGGRRFAAGVISPMVMLFLVAYLVTVFPVRICTMTGAN